MENRRNQNRYIPERIQWEKAIERFEIETGLKLGICIKDGKFTFPVQVTTRMASLASMENVTWTQSYIVKVSESMCNELKAFFKREDIAPHLYELLVRQNARVIHHDDLYKQVHGLKETAKCLLSLVRKKEVWKTLSYFLTPEQEQAVVTLANMDTSILHEVKPTQRKKPKHRPKDPYVESLAYLVRALDSVKRFWDGKGLKPHQKALLLALVGVPLKGKTLRKFVVQVKNLDSGPLALV